MLSSSLLPILALVAGVSANDALRANPANVDIGLTQHGSDWLWAVFAIMLLSDIAFIVWHRSHGRNARRSAATGPGATGTGTGVGATGAGVGNNNNGVGNVANAGGSRVFHHLAVVILTLATIAYFAMASNLGQTGVQTEFNRHGTRSIWYVRYIFWTLATPLLLLELVLATSLSLSDIATLLFFQVALIVTRLLGALVHSRYKWGFYTMSLAFMFYVIYLLMGPGRRSAGVLSDAHRGPFTRGSGYVSLLWLLYPICWGLAEGSNHISVTGEMIFYGILDILVFPVFLFYHVHTLSRANLNHHGFNGLTRGHGNGAGYGYNNNNGYDTEKHGLTNHGATVPMSGQNTAGTASTGVAGAPVMGRNNI